MERPVAHYLQTLPGFLAYFGVAAALAGVFVMAYLWCTPQREIALIREGNLSASLCLSTALLGVVLPLASALAHSVSLGDLAAWGGVALAVQLFVHMGTRVLLPDLRGRIERDQVAAAVLCGAIHLGAGLLNAAALVY